MTEKIKLEIHPIKYANLSKTHSTAGTTVLPNKGLYRDKGYSRKTPTLYNRGHFLDFNNTVFQVHVLYRNRPKIYAYRQVRGNGRLEIL